MLQCYHINIHNYSIQFHIKVILAIIVSWVISAIITAAGGFPEGSLARTDSRLDVLNQAEWIRIPYPGNQVVSRYRVQEITSK